MTIQELRDLRIQLGIPVRVVAEYLNFDRKTLADFEIKTQVKHRAKTLALFERYEQLLNDVAKGIIKNLFSQ